MGTVNVSQEQVRWMEKAEDRDGGEANLKGALCSLGYWTTANAKLVSCRSTFVVLFEGMI